MPKKPCQRTRRALNQAGQRTYLLQSHSLRFWLILRRARRSKGRKTGTKRGWGNPHLCFARSHSAGCVLTKGNINGEIQRVIDPLDLKLRLQARTRPLTCLAHCTRRVILQRVNDTLRYRMAIATEPFHGLHTDLLSWIRAYDHLTFVRSEEELPGSLAPSTCGGQPTCRHP